LALSRGAILIGREVAKAFETSLDVLLVRQIECDGRPLGAVAEDGTSLIDEEAVSRSALDRKTMQTIVAAARQACRDESILLRGARWIIDISNRTVVLVSEGATSEWPTAVAASMCRSMGARRIVAAAPAVSAAAVPAMARHVDEITCVERVQDPTAIAMLYRDRREPSDREAVDLLSAAATAQ
jgi:putative phosphoribosyl transferase